MIINSEQKKLSVEVIDKVLELTTMALAYTKHDLFVAYSPHVEAVHVRLYIGGWCDEIFDEEDECSIDRTIYLHEGEGSVLLIQTVINDIKAAIDGH